MVRLAYSLFGFGMVVVSSGCGGRMLAESMPQVPQEQRQFDALLAKYPDLTYRQLADETPRRVYQEGLSFDPATAKFYDEAVSRLQLTEQERELLRANGFVSVDHDQRYSFGSLYFAVYSNDLPVLITTDSVLHAMHRSYDDVLMELEQTVFTDLLAEVLRKCHEELGATAPTWGSAAANYRDVDLYLTVARNLLRGAGAPTAGRIHEGLDNWSGDLLIPSELEQDDEVLKVLWDVRSLELQSGARGEVTSIYGGERAIDYSQFKTRGHYTKTAPLARYFRTMMWLGRADTGWYLLPPDPASEIVCDTPREARDAALLALLLRSTGSVAQLEQVNRILDFLIGKSDNLGVPQLLELLERQKVEAIKDLAWGSQVEAFQQALVESENGEQKIRSQVVVSNPQDLHQVAPPREFQLFGQRFIVDSFVLSKVVYDSIVFDGAKVERHMPTGLDVMYALGNDTTLPLMEGNMTKYPYASNLKASREFVEQQPAAFWQENLYNLWLSSLRSLDDDWAADAHVPEAMRTAAWQRKQLQTQLASWSELRHNTVLYAKQSYGAEASCEYPTGYVEPYPEAYARIKFFAEEAARRIGAADFRVPGKDHAEMQRKQVEFFKQMAVTLGKLETLANKELAAEPFTKDDEFWLKQAIDIRSRGSGMPTYSGWYCQLFYGGPRQGAEWDPTVVDVHTDPNTQSVLEVATGSCNFLVTAIDNEDDRMIYVGPVYSYYEFQQPAPERLTDQEWKRMLQMEKEPPRPAWTESFQADKLRRHAGRPQLE